MDYQVTDSRQLWSPGDPPLPAPHLLKGWGGTQGGMGTERGTRGVRLVSARHTDAPLIPRPSAQDTFRDSLVKGKGHPDENTLDWHSKDPRVTCDEAGRADLDVG